MDPLIDIKGLSVDFDDGQAHVRALHGIDLALAPREALGIVGESGCGKSITWLAALGLLGKRARVRGSVTFRGQELVDLPEPEMAKVRGGKIAMIFQDPSSSLNPLHRIGWQLNETLARHRGLTGEAAKAEALRLLDRVGIADAPRRLRDYPHELSGGMNQRVMIAMALAGEPDVLVADEPTTALDATIQAQILALIAEIRAQEDMALVLISHDLGVVSELAERVMVMYCGRVVEDASVDRIFSRPGHPYTEGLLAALPALEGPRQKLVAIPGTVPPPQALPPGCAFAPRCAQAEAACRDAVPALSALAGPAHRAACRLAQPEPAPARKTEEVA